MLFIMAPMGTRLLKKELIDRACDVLGNGSTAAEWFELPHPALAGKTPAETAKSQAGRKLVLRLLGRIEQGLIS